MICQTKVDSKNSLLLLDAFTNNLLKSVTVDNYNDLRNLIFSPDGRLFACKTFISGDGNKITVWDIDTLKSVFELPIKRDFDVNYIFLHRQQKINNKLLHNLKSKQSLPKYYLGYGNR